MEASKIVRYMDRHPWLSLATGIGIATFSLLRIRRDRQERHRTKLEARAEKQAAKAKKRMKKGVDRLEEKSRPGRSR